MAENNTENQAEIRRLIESCQTPAGGWNAIFFECMGVPVASPGFRVPKGWKKDAEAYLPLGVVRDAVAKYHAAEGKRAGVSVCLCSQGMP